MEPRASFGRLSCLRPTDEGLNQQLAFTTIPDLLSPMHPITPVVTTRACLSSQAGRTRNINKAHGQLFHNSLTANTENVCYILEKV